MRVAVWTNVTVSVAVSTPPVSSVLVSTNVAVMVVRVGYWYPPVGGGGGCGNAEDVAGSADDAVPGIEILEDEPTTTELVAGWMIDDVPLPYGGTVLSLDEEAGTIEDVKRDDEGTVAGTRLVVRVAGRPPDGDTVAVVLPYGGTEDVSVCGIAEVVFPPTVVGNGTELVDAGTSEDVVGMFAEDDMSSDEVAGIMTDDVPLAGTNDDVETGMKLDVVFIHGPVDELTCVAGTAEVVKGREGETVKVETLKAVPVGVKVGYGGMLEIVTTVVDTEASGPGPYDVVLYRGPKEEVLYLDVVLDRVGMCHVGGGIEPVLEVLFDAGPGPGPGADDDGISTLDVVSGTTEEVPFWLTTTEDVYVLILVENVGNGGILFVWSGTYDDVELPYGTELVVIGP